MLKSIPAKAAVRVGSCPPQPHSPTPSLESIQGPAGSPQGQPEVAQWKAFCVRVCQYACFSLTGFILKQISSLV